MGPLFSPGALFEQTWQSITRQCYIPNTKALGLVVSNKKIFCFLYICLFKTLDPWGGTTLWPQGHNLNKLNKVSLGYATYQKSMEPRGIILKKNLVEVYYGM